jgi:hypothetical protein
VQCSAVKFSAVQCGAGGLMPAVQCSALWGLSLLEVSRLLTVYITAI